MFPTQPLQHLSSWLSVSVPLGWSSSGCLPSPVLFYSLICVSQLWEALRAGIPQGLNWNPFFWREFHLLLGTWNTRSLTIIFLFPLRFFRQALQRQAPNPHREFMSGALKHSSHSLPPPVQSQGRHDTHTPGIQERQCILYSPGTGSSTGAFDLWVNCPSWGR